MSKSNETLKCLITELFKKYKVPCVFIIKDKSMDRTYPCVLRNGEIDLGVLRSYGDCDIKSFDIKKTVCITLVVDSRE